MSLGVDPIFHISTCSFNCVYCQLGQIQSITTTVKEYVPTQKIVDDFKVFQQKKIDFDVFTFSGSGEPTLALNLKEMVMRLKQLCPNKPFHILTNATELDKNSVQSALECFDKVTVKIDAASEKMFKQVNRPADGVTLESTVNAIQSLPESVKQKVEIQSMFMPMNQAEIDSYVDLMKKIRPKVIQLNTPKRPYPSQWARENRGNHELIFNYPISDLKKISQETAAKIETALACEVGCEVISVYR